MPWDLPEEIEQRLKFDHNRDLQQHHVAEIFVHGDRPYYNIRRIDSELSGKFDRGTIRDRLEEMEERGVIYQESINNGTIYWLAHEDSDWPVPNDVRVESAKEKTVSEFFGQTHILFMAVGVLFSMLSGPIIWAGSLQSAGSISTPFATQTLLAGGLSTIFFAYGFIILGILFWVLMMASREIDWRELVETNKPE